MPNNTIQLKNREIVISGKQISKDMLTKNLIKENLYSRGKKNFIELEIMQKKVGKKLFFFRKKR